MSHHELERLLEHYERQQCELEASREQIWRCFAAAAPELAAELVALFSTMPAALAWALVDLRSLGASPVRAVAQGRSAEVRALVQRTLHGFVG